MCVGVEACADVEGCAGAVGAEHVPTGEVAHTCTAYVTLVSLGEDEKPVVLPAVEPQTSEDERRHRDANRRRELRLASSR